MNNNQVCSSEISWLQKTLNITCNLRTTFMILSWRFLVFSDCQLEVTLCFDCTGNNSVTILLNNIFCVPQMKECHSGSYGNDMLLTKLFQLFLNCGFLRASTEVDDVEGSCGFRQPSEVYYLHHLLISSRLLCLL